MNKKVDKNMLKQSFLLVASLFYFGDVIYGCLTPRPHTTLPLSQKKLRTTLADFSPESVKTVSSVQSKFSRRSEIVGGIFEMIVDKEEHSADQDLAFGFFLDLSSDDEEVNKINTPVCSASSSRLNSVALSRMGRESALTLFASSFEPCNVVKPVAKHFKKSLKREMSNDVSDNDSELRPSPTQVAQGRKKIKLLQQEEQQPIEVKASRKRRADNNYPSQSSAVVSEENIHNYVQKDALLFQKISANSSSANQTK